MELLHRIIIFYALFIVLYPFNIKGEEYRTIIVHGNYSQSINVRVDSNKEFIILYPDSLSENPYTVSVWSEEADPNFPVFVMVRQQKEAISWEVPLDVETSDGILRFYNTSRTLCYNGINEVNDTGNNGFRKHLSISLSTAFKIATSLIVRVEEESEFYLKEDKNYSIVISPSQPRFFSYKYQMDKQPNLTDTVILEIDSDDDVCFTVSIQNATCPVMDLNENISYEGKYETINTRGGIIIERKLFPSGFFIVFVAKGDNFDCNKKTPFTSLLQKENMKPIVRSSVHFVIKSNITKAEFVTGIYSVVIAILVFYMIFIALTWGFHRCKNVTSENDDITDILIEEEEPTNAELEESLQRENEIANEGSVRAYPRERANVKLRKAVPGSIDIANEGSSTVAQPPTEQTDHELEGSFQRDILEQNHHLTISCLNLCHLIKEEPRRLQQASLNYFWHVLSVAIFYGIPAVQVVITYQEVVTVTGDLDICYYNFLCAHPMWGLRDFNHVFSNIGYIMCGILFLLIVGWRHKFVTYNDKLGIPKHYGLFYAMGTALIMEGILSACFHVCPNQSNFQFDTSFMYVMAVLCIVKLYQNRHPSVNVTSNATFLMLALATFAAMVGILHQHIVMWIIFIYVYIILCFFISSHVYFLGFPKRGIFEMLDALKRERTEETGSLLVIMKPKRKVRFILLAISNVLNVIASHLGILCYYLGLDFATFLLGLLLLNAIYYTIVYIVLKVRHKETICLEAKYYVFLAALTWSLAIYFFLDSPTTWKVTAANSRHWNTHCKLLIYDNHDIWHFLSAPALFFSFMLLLCLDDDLISAPHAKIPVF